MSLASRLTDLTIRIATEFKNRTASTLVALNLKANIESPTFTGTVTAPTFIGNLTGTATGNLTGTGTINQLAKFTASGTVGNSVITELANGKLGVNQPNPTEGLDVVGNGKFSGTLLAGTGVSIGNSLPTTDQFNVYNKIRMLNDGSDSIIIGGSIISAGAKFRQLYEDYNWTVPTGNAGMIGMYADIYLHQIASAFSTVVANESYANMSCAAGIINAGRQIGYLGGCMVMSGHRGTLENLSGAQIINRIRPGAAGAVGSMSGVQAGLTAYDVNSVAIQEFRAFETLLYDLKGATIVDSFGLYLNPAKRTGVTRGWGVYQESLLDVNHFAGKVRIGYVLGSDIPDSTFKVDVLGSFRASEGLTGAGLSVTQNVNRNKPTATAESYDNFLINGVIRWSQLFGGAENGGISGSNIEMYRYDDFGGYLGQAYNISRATGKFSIGEQLEAKSVKIKSATLNPSPEAGTLEFDGTDLYFVTPLGRKKIAFVP